MDIGNAVVLTTRGRRERLARFRRDVPGCIPALVNRVQGDPVASCANGHRKIWEMNALTSNLLIFEDDAYAKIPRWVTFIDRLHPPVEWDILYLGGRHFIPPTVIGLISGEYRWVKCAWTHQTHAYVVRDPRVLLRRTTKIRGTIGKVEHVDRTLQTIGIRRIGVDPFIFGQRAGVSDIGKGRMVDT